jgi:hypothetical protein
VKGFLSRAEKQLCWLRLEGPDACGHLGSKGGVYII